MLLNTLVIWLRELLICGSTVSEGVVPNWGPVESQVLNSSFMFLSRRGGQCAGRSVKVTG